MSATGDLPPCPEFIAACERGDVFQRGPRPLGPDGFTPLAPESVENARKAEQAERRAEDAEAEVERLRSLLSKVRRVFDLQCPPLLPAKYDSQGAWMAHTWWDRVLGAVLREVDACEWCGRSDGHANGCRLGLGPDEHGSECACVPPYANCSHPPCGCPDCVRGLRADCDHHWLDRPESDTRECLICGTEETG